MEKYIFNLILENILYENIWNNWKISLYIANNDIKIEKKENQIYFNLNWIGISRKYEKNNYSDFIINLSDWLYSIITLYVIECEKNNYSNNDIMEMWQE